MARQNPDFRLRGNDVSRYFRLSQWHLNVWAPNFGIQEYLVPGAAACDALFPSGHKMEHGRMYVSDEPGLGVDFNADESRQYQYKPDSHPAVRLDVGTRWNYSI